MTWKGPVSTVDAVVMAPRVDVRQCDECPFWQPVDFERDFMCVHPETTDGNRPKTPIDGKSMPEGCPLRKRPVVVTRAPGSASTTTRSRTGDARRKARKANRG